MRTLLLTLLLLLPFSLMASHIVGGEFELQHLSGNRYRLSLNMYIDNNTSQPNLVFPTVNASIFEKGTNKLIRNVTLDRKTQTAVPYSFIDCTIDRLSTGKVLYWADITLESNIFNHPQGYYLSNERCCRNGAISNIEDPGFAGQTFYMEFPAVVRGASPFLNSSPKLFPPVSDYACLGTPFYFNFGGADPDGDSLVYSMVAPLQGNSNRTDVIPIGKPWPYAPVKWLAGFSETVQVAGTQPLRVGRQTGILTVTPRSQGLFVFGVKCEEYRAGVKIGEIRRDYQLLVILCPSNEAPRVYLKEKSGGGFYAENQVIRIKGNENRCLDVFLSDTQANERLTIRALPLNFTLPDPLLPITSGIVNRNGLIDSVKTEVCLPSCLDSQGQVYKMNLIVSDNGCSLPKTDTLLVSFIIEPIPDAPPTISTTAAPVIPGQVGDLIQFLVLGADPDLDLVKISAKGQGFDLASLGITFPEATGTGSATGTFKWTLTCEAAARSSWKVDFTVTTMQCGQPVEETLTVEIQPDFANSPPELRLNPGALSYALSYFAQVEMEVLGTDADRHGMVLLAEGVGFDMAAYGMSFPATTGAGNVSSRFTWLPTCTARDREEFQVRFVLREQNCRPAATQETFVTFRLPLPEKVEFKPANIFTPNGDTFNDWFEMPNLPPDFCESIFSNIQIYNRWGVKVYESKDRAFKWDGESHSEGVFYYLITFSDTQYKGTVTLVR